MEALEQGAQGFIGMFEAGGAHFMALVTGIVPTLIMLITAVNALTQLIGAQRVEAFARRISHFAFTRYTLLPVLALFFLTNPMAYAFGRFLPERYKPAFYDAAVSFCHPFTGLFPHVNAGEIFVYMGIASGVAALGLPLGDLAVRYFLVGLAVILLRGLVTERITAIMMNKGGRHDA